MNSKFQYDKKQLPQVIAMAVLSLGLFGFFGYRMMAPPPTQAAPAKTAAAPAGGAPGQPGAVQVASADIDAPAPSDSMRDPFLMPHSAKAAIGGPQPSGPTFMPEPPPALPVKAPPFMPSLPSSGPSVASVQPFSPGNVGSPGGVAAPAAPAVQAGPAWQVTGVIIGDSGSDNHIAILRDGDQRRYVRPGAMVDGEYRVEAIDRDGVTLSRGHSTYRLSLGTADSAPKHVPAPSGNGFSAG